MGRPTAKGTPLNFGDGAAFRLKSGRELARALLVLRLCAFPRLVRHAGTVRRRRSAPPPWGGRGPTPPLSFATPSPDVDPGDLAENFGVPAVGRAAARYVLRAVRGGRDPRRGDGGGGAAARRGAAPHVGRPHRGGRGAGEGRVGGAGRGFFWGGGGSHPIFFRSVWGREEWYEANRGAALDCVGLAAATGPHPMMQLKVTALMSARLCVSPTRPCHAPPRPTRIRGEGARAGPPSRRRRSSPPPPRRKRCHDGWRSRSPS